MKYQLEIIKGEIDRKKPVVVDQAKLAEKVSFITNWLNDEGLTPPNDSIKAALIKYLSEARAGYRVKGLFLTGQIGTGKSFASKIISTCEGYSYYETVDLATMYKKNLKEFNVISGNYSQNIIIDDLGAEPTVNSYGIKEETLAVMIDGRFRTFNRAGCKTIITTNLTKDQVIERYGARIYSRIRDMCECVVTNGTDLRLNGGK